MDRRGRRRPLLIALGAAAGVVLASMAGLLIGGLFGTSPVPLPGLPDRGQGIQPRDDGAGLAPAPPASPRPVSPRPVSPRPATSAAPATVTAPTSATHPGNKPTSHPGNAKPERTR
jgi:hypothetical protein